MKRIFRRNNTTSKIIALWLVLVMLVTPLMSYVGQKSGAKAEANDIPTITVQIPVSGGITVSAGIATLNLTEGKVTQEILYSVADRCSVNLTVNEGTITYNNTPVDEYQITRVIEKNGTELVDPDTFTEGDTMTVGLKISFFDNDGNSIETEEIEAAEYTFVKSDSIIGTAIWDTNGDSGDYHKNATVAGVTVDVSALAGVIKYAYTDCTDGNTAYADYEDALAGKWTTDVITVTDTGNYVGFVGYFADENSEAPLQVTELGVIKIDADAPVIGSYGIYGSSDNFVTKSPVDNKTTVREDSGFDYRYYIKVSDEVSGIQSVVINNGNQDIDITANIVDGEYYCDFTPELSYNTYTVVVTDSAGNSTGTIELGSIAYADSDRAEITPYWNLKEDGSTSDPTGDTPTNKQNSLTVKAETYKEIYEIVVIYQDEYGYAQKISSSKLTGVTPDPYYEYEVTFSLPETETPNATLNEIQVQMYDSSGSEIGSGVTDLGSIAYDRTLPIFKWDDSATYIQPGSNWYTEEENYAKISVGSGTSSYYESDLASVTYTISNSVEDTSGTIAINDDQSDKSNVSGIIKIPNSASVTGTTVVINAKDMAGNESSEKVTFYVDAAAPKWQSGKVGTFSYVDNMTVNLLSTSITATFTDNIGVVKVKYQCNGKEYVTEDITDGTATADLFSNILNDSSKASGVYAVTITAYDKAGNASTPKTITFTYDNDIPSATYTFVHKAFGADWSTAQTVTGIKTTSDGKVYYINKSIDTDVYAFHVTATDATSKIDETKLSNGEWYSIEPGDNEYDGDFYIVVDSSKLDATVQKQITDFIIKDTAGNSSAPIEFSPALFAVDEEIVMTAQLLDKNGKTVKITNDIKKELASGTNEKYYVKITVEGPNKFTQVYIGDSDGEITGATKEVSKDNVYTTEKRYQYVATFAVPSGSGAEKYSSLKAVASDGNKTVKQSLLTLLYDTTKPMVVNSVKDYTSYAAPEGWVKSAKFGAAVISGTGDDESDLTYARYSIDNGEVVSFDLNNAVATTNTVKLPDSQTTNGTKIVVAAQDAAGNSINKTYRFYVDGTAPTIDKLAVGGNEVNVIPLTGTPSVSTTVNDNLTLQQIQIDVTYPDKKTVKSKTVNYSSDKGLVNGNSVTTSYKLETLTGKNVPDGQYKVKVKVVDKAGNSTTKTATFIVDNTIPVVSAKISGGTQSEKNAVYYRSDVSVQLAYKEDNIQTVTVTDNGDVLPITWSEKKNSGGYYTAVVSISAEGGHNIKISAVDQSGHQAKAKEVYFVVDKGVPTVSVSVNGLPYSGGIVDSTTDATIGVNISDLTASDLYYQVIVTKPDQESTTSVYEKSDINSFAFAAEGDYTMNFYAVDTANNQGPVTSVNFRIDKTAPAINISGITNGGTSQTAITANVSVQEAFWWDTTATVNIYHKSGDGASETLYKTINMNLTGFETGVSETLADTGVYRIEVSASDRAGHTTESSQSYTIDMDAPEITITGVGNYDVTDSTIDFQAQVNDAFYLNKTVEVTGTRTDITGKVNKIQFSSYYQSGNPTTIEESFNEDGIYDIVITSYDLAGNSSSREIRFTIDKTAPVIGTLPDYDGAILTYFNWDVDLDELISDLTVCEVHMYLNGSEYDGVSEIEDGSYTLLITAEDELGHYVEKSVSFILDTKAPVFIVTGVEDGEVKNEAYTIDISLQLDEDILNSVTLNGDTITVVDNTAHIEVSEKGSYKLVLNAVDEAGNEATQAIEFKYGEETHWWLWLIIIICVLLIVFIIVWVVRKNKKKK